MTFNVRLDTASDGEDAWPARREFVADVIDDADPAVVGLQEPLAHQLASLEGALDHEWIGVGRRDGADAGEFAPVGYDPDRFDLLAGDTIWLSEAPRQPGSVGWDAEHPRIATWALLADRETGRRLLACNTHLDHEGREARREGTRLLLDRLADLPAHDLLVLTGDFNCPPSSPPHRLVTRDERGPRLRDAREVAAEVLGPEGTFHGFDGDPCERIDYVFVGGDVDVRRYETVTEHRGDRYPSDHFPVVVDLLA